MSMEKTPILNKNISTRLSFSSINEIVPIPNLLKISKSSYNKFLQRFESYEKRLDIGLQLILKKYFGNSFLYYSLGVSDYSSEECLENGVTYSIPLYVYLRILKQDKIDIKRYYLGEIPLLTDNGSFIVNGIENTVINQLVRDAGIYIHKSKSPFVKTSLKIRGLKGRSMQLDLFFDSFIGQKLDTKSILSSKILNHNTTHQEIDRYLDNLKISFKEIGETFTYSINEYKYCKSGWYLDFDWKNVLKHRFIKKSNVEMLCFQSFSEKNLLTKNDFVFMLNTIVNNKFISNQTLSRFDYYLLDVYENGESIFKTKFDGSLQEIEFRKKFVEKIGLHINKLNKDSFFLEQELILDKNYSYVFYNLKEQPDPVRNIVQVLIELKKKKLISYYQNIMYQDNKNEDTSDNIIFNNFKLGAIGRLKINLKFGLNEKSEELTSRDFRNIVRYLIQLDKNLIEKDYYEEQSLLSRRFNNIGQHLYSCLNDFLKNDQEKKYIVTTQLDILNNSVLLKKLQNFRSALSFLLRYLNKSSLCQYTEQANALSYLGHTRKASIMGPGGLKSDNISLEMRDVNISTYGRICPIETPEGKSVGVVSNLSVYTRTNKYFELETPYVYVQNGKVTNIIHYLTPHEEKYYRIAHSTENTDKNGCFINKKEVYCRYLHNVVTVVAEKVNYVEVSSRQLVSISASMIPFLEHNDGNRALMGSNMQKQAVPLMNLEKSLVGTGAESVIGRDLNNLLNFNKTFFRDIGNDSAHGIRYDLMRQIDTDISGNRISFNSFVNCFVNSSYSYNNIRHKNSNQKTHIDFKYLPVMNSYYRWGFPIKTGYSLKNEELCLGNNVLIGFTSMNGHTFEDSIVISERIIRDGYFHSIHLEVYKTMELYEKDSQEIIKNIIGSSSLDHDGVVLIGTSVEQNNIVIGKEKRQLQLFEKNKLIVYDKSIRYKNKKKGVVIQVTKFFDHYNDLNKQYSKTSFSSFLQNQFNSYIFKEELIRSRFLNSLLRIDMNSFSIKRGKRLDTNNLLIHINKYSNWFSSLFLTNIVLDADRQTSEKIFLYRSYIYYMYRYIFLTNNILDISKKNILKELTREDLFRYFDSRFKSVCKQAIKKNKSFFLDLQQIKIPLKKMNVISSNASQINSLKSVLEESLLRFLFACMVLFFIREYSKQNTYAYENDSFIMLNKVHNMSKKRELLRSNYSLKMVKVVVACQHQLQVGDKLTGRYGNKGVISRILSIEDMPYLKDGTPIDIILSPLGVSSRMNIGQLLECHLGLAGVELGKKLQRIFTSYRNTLLNKSRIFLSNLYRNKKELIYLQNLDENQLISLSKNLAHGTSISTSIFDSAKNIDIDNLLRISGLNIQGKVSLIDGVTGTLLDNKVMIGYMYMIKLNHLIDHKIHGRSTGPYNVITQQASKGKSRNGGQRLGEMEVWALQAYGAAYTLQEMLTFKSDSTISRSNFLQNFIRGKTYKIDIPRTFKLLRDELRVLGMELSFIVRRS